MRNMIHLYIVITLAGSFLCTGCSSVPRPILFELETANKCVHPTGDRPTQPTPVLVDQGNDYLDRALGEISSPPVDAVLAQALLSQSGLCFSRALRQTPDSYEAQLGMGVGYLARARLADKDSMSRLYMMAGARHMLGRAYMLRHGAYEPLYYLAELAMLEGNLKLAWTFLEPLRQAGTKEGPVNLLLGSLSERQGKRLQAASFYAKALEAGWPSEIFVYAAGRLEELEIRHLSEIPLITRRR